MIQHRFPPEAGLDDVPDDLEPTLPVVQPSALDRHVDLARISGETLAWVAVLLVAALVRVIGLTSWPLSAGEAGIASDALALVQGGSLSPGAATHPLSVDLVALGIYLFGASDTVVRLIPAALGIGSILLLFPARPWFGRGPALGAATAMALSPTLVFASRTVDGGSLIVAGSLLLLVAIGRASDRPGFGSLFALGVAGALLPLAGPLGWVAIPLALVVAPGITGRWLPRPSAIPAVTLGFLTMIIVVSTSLFTRPGGFSDFMSTSLNELWSRHLATVSDGWFLIPIEAVLYELLPLVFAFYAVYLLLWNSRRLSVATERLARTLVAWTLLAGIVAMVTGGKVLEHYSLVVVPLALLAGVGLSAASGAVEWRSLSQGRGAWFLASLLLTIAAGVSAFDLLLRGPDNEALRWGTTVLVVVLLILAPLVLLTLSLARGMRGRAGPIAVFVLAVLLAAYGMRSSLLLAATNLDRPGGLLLVGSTAPDVRFVLQRLQRLSLDLTATRSDLRDPIGGHGLTIAIDRPIAEPFTWYLREYPDVTLVEPGARDTDTGRVSFQAIVTRPEDGSDLVLQHAGYVERSYALSVPLALAFDRPPSLSRLAEAVINPRILKRYFDFLSNRELAAAAKRPQFVLALRADLADRVFGKPAPSP